MRLSEAHAEELAEVRDALAQFPDIAVLEDAREALAHLASGGIAVIMPTPRVRFTTSQMWECTWEAWALTPYEDPATSTQALTDVLDTFATLGAESAQPDTFETSTGPVYHGYIITTSSTYSER